MRGQEVQLVLGFGIGVLLMLFLPKGTNVLPRWRGWLLLTLYGAYVVAIVHGQTPLG